MTTHSKDRLAEALRKADLVGLADLAAAGHYHDFLSPLDDPAMQLARDLEVAIHGGNLAAQAILARHMQGDFDATKAESDEWAASAEGRDAMARLVDDGRRRRPVSIGRLAMREEGKWWVGYYALEDSMVGAVELGRIAMAFVEEDERRRAFLDFMRAAVGDIIEGQTGQRPSWTEERPAPAHERSGKA